MSKFSKQVLSVGTYRAGGVDVVVTPERLKHWEDVFGQMRLNGLTVPMHWDHAPKKDIENLSPIRMSIGNETAKNTVGRLVDFKVIDGQSAELTVQTLTPSAREAVESNAIFVSPVLLEQFTDGFGVTYKDIIGSVDLVDYPVDHTQGPFVPVQERKQTPVLMSCVQRNGKTQITKFSLEQKMDGKDYEKENEESEVTTMSEETEASETPAEPSQSPTLTAVIEGLAKMKVVVPAADTTTENFLERLNTALLTALAQQDMVDEPAEQVSDTVVDPAVATMSARVNQLEQRILSGERDSLKERLQGLLNSGRCTPAEHDKHSKDLAVTRMSLKSDNSVDCGDVGRWIADRETLPQGACWDKEEKVQRMSCNVVEPKSQYSNKEGQDVEQMRRQKAEMLRR